MSKRITLTILLVMFVATFTISAVPNKTSTSAFFFQYSYDNEFSQIDSIGAYIRASTFNDNQIGGSFGTTFELPIGYSNNRMSMKYSLFGGPSLKFKIKGDDNILTIGPSIVVTLLTDKYYIAEMFDLGIFVDVGTIYPISEKFSAVMGASLIFDLGRYSVLETSSSTSQGFEQDFFQISGKIYLGFSINR